MRETALGNIGYLCGYMGMDECTRIQSLFEAEHPVFGKMWGQP